jgi:hypothetical protein
MNHSVNDAKFLDLAFDVHCFGIACFKRFNYMTAPIGKSFKKFSGQDKICSALSSISERARPPFLFRTARDQA